MHLSIVVFTRNHAEWLPRILPQLRGVADELVVVVNQSTRDNSEEVARRYTGRVLLVPHEAIPERQAQRFVEYCRGDWILSLTDDETLSHHWEDRAWLERLLADRYATHYWIPRRWLLPPGERFIANGRWYPDYQMRLFRNLPSLIEYPGELHTVPAIAGQARYLADAWMYHWDFVWRDRAAREQKIVEYRTATADPLAEYYLYEEQSFEIEAKEFGPRSPKATYGWKPEIPTSCDVRFRVLVIAAEVPGRMKAGARYAVTVAIVNESDRVIQPSSNRLRAEVLRVSYHWFPVIITQGDSRDLGWENARHELPARIERGGSSNLILSVEAPAKPGDYLLQFDLVEEGTAWYSEHAPGAKHVVSVSG